MKRILSLSLTLMAALLLAGNLSTAKAAQPATPTQTETVRLSCGAEMKIEVCAPGIFRVRISPDGSFPQSLMERYGILKTDWEKPSVKEQRDADKWTLTTSTHALTVDLKAQTIGLKDASGKELVDGISFHPGGSTLSRVLRDSIQVQYGDMVTRRNGGIIGDDDGSLSEMDKTEGGDPLKSCVIRIPIKADERFYGGGSTSREHIQHRGERLRMWATYQHTEIPMPFMMSSEGWGIYSNSTRKSYFDMGRLEKDAFSIYTTTPEADFYLIAADGMPGILDAYTQLTGRNYLLPKWAYGFCFGPNMKEDQWNILSDARDFRAMGMPCDVFWLEPQWMSKHYDFSSAKDWNYNKFSPEYSWKQNDPVKRYNPSLFIGRMRDMGLHLGLWICEEYDLSIAEEDALPGAKPSGLEHWMDHLKKFVTMGAEGFKLDPARTLDEHTYRKYYNGRPDKEMHNLNQVLLPKQMNLMYREHTGKRGWYHYCAGWSGTQHWGASTSGDNGGGKTALFDQLNLGNSGYMNTSCDVMHVSREQEMQSLHFGAFLPWVAVNSYAHFYHPFYFTGKEREIYLNCIKLRYELIPYIWSAAIEGVLTGMPMVRSMPLMFPADRAVDDLWTQYMFGPNLLVGIFTDEIYLPAGEWTDAWTGEKIQSHGETVKRPCPEGRAGLLFIRGGAIIPTMEAADHIDIRPQREFIVNVYPWGESEYIMNDCDAESYGYEQGLVARTRFRCSKSGKAVKLTVDPVEGRFENMPDTRDYRFRVALDRKPSKVHVNGVKMKDWTWSAPGEGTGTLTVNAGSCPVSETLTLTILF